jgi:hypothetical protein
VLEVRVAVGSATVPGWQRDCIAALRALDGVHVRVVAVAAAPWTPPRGPAAKLAGPMLAPATVVLDKPGDALAESGDTLAGAQIVVDLTGTLRADRALRADGAAEVWYFRLGENGGSTLPFEREIAQGRDTFEIALVRRTRGREETLRTGRFSVTRWYASTLRVALREAARWPATFAAALHAGAPLDATEAAPVAPRGALPFQRVRFGLALARRLAGALLAYALETTEWNVGFAPGSARDLIAGAPLDVRWLPQPAPLTFIADPFVVERDGLRVLFVEEYDYARDRGVLDALILDEHDAVVRRERALDIATHVSYPFPLEIDGELYFVPENCAANEVVLYRCAEFPARWLRESAIFPGFDGVDTTLFAHEERWWAFCTRYTRGSMLGLYAFHAPSPRGPWTEHLLNPVVVDVGSARPAGAVFHVDGVPYRPGQDCTRSYGCGLTLARIDRLTPNAYRETVVRRIDGRGLGRYRDGIHTIGFTARGIVVDGKRDAYDARKLGWVLKKIRARAGRLLARSR